MIGAFAPRLDILPEPQRRLWDDLAATPEAFVLYGSTAIALHLGHRQSVDFGFVGSRPFDPERLAEESPLMAGAVATQRGPSTLSAIVDRRGPVNISFFAVPGLPRLTPSHRASGNGLQVASLLDLAGTKVNERRAVAGRGERL